MKKKFNILFTDSESTYYPYKEVLVDTDILDKYIEPFNVGDVVLVNKNMKISEDDKPRYDATDIWIVYGMLKFSNRYVTIGARYLYCTIKETGQKIYRYRILEETEKQEEHSWPYSVFIKTDIPNIIDNQITVGALVKIREDKLIRRNEIDASGLLISTTMLKLKGETLRVASASIGRKEDKEGTETKIPIYTLAINDKEFSYAWTGKILQVIKEYEVGSKRKVRLKRKV